MRMRPFSPRRCLLPLVEIEIEWPLRVRLSRLSKFMNKLARSKDEPDFDSHQPRHFPIPVEIPEQFSR